MVKFYVFHGESRLFKVAYIEVFLRMASVVIWVGDPSANWENPDLAI
jgi:hypothetical protein